jgi:flagellar biogenesis protein FliO
MPWDGVGLFTAGSLLLVAALGVGVRLLRRDLRTTGRHLELVATLALGPGKHLQLVRAVNDMYLIGSADKQLTLLATIPAEQAMTLLQGAMLAGRSRSRRRTGAEARVAGTAALDFGRELREAMTAQGVGRGGD